MIVGDWRAPLLVGTLLRVAAWVPGLWNQSWVEVDTRSYWALSSDGLAGYGATEGQLYHWGLMRPPGYPAILAVLRAFGDSYAVVALLQILFGVTALVLTYHLARRLAGERVAVLAAWWLALSPMQIVHSSTLLTEIPFSVFLLAALLLVAPLVEGDVIEHWRWAGAGLLVGLATLVRPIALYLPLVVLAVMAFSRLPRRFAISGLLFVAGFAVPVSGWMVRNHKVTGVVILSTIEGINLAYYRAAGAVAVEENVPVRVAREQMASLVQAESDPLMNPAELSRVAARVGIRKIMRHPSGYAYSAARGLAYTLVGPARSYFVERFRGTPVEVLTLPVVAASAVSAILMTIGSIVGVLAWARAHEWRKLLLIAVPLLYMLLIAAGQEAWARFRVPVEPLLAILAAVGLMHLWTWLGRRRRRWASGAAR